MWVWVEMTLWEMRGEVCSLYRDIELFPSMLQRRHHNFGTAVSSAGIGVDTMWSRHYALGIDTMIMALY